MTQYVVVENTPGYMPEDTDPGVFDSLEDARVYASDLLSSLLDDYVQASEEDDAGKAYARLSIQGSFQEDRTVYVVDTGRAHEPWETSPRPAGTRRSTRSLPPHRSSGRAPGNGARSRLRAES